MNFYETIYGVSLSEYCNLHDITIEELIKKKEKDIQILKENYKKYSSRNTELSDEELKVAQKIKSYLDKKRLDLERIKSNFEKEHEDINVNDVVRIANDVSDSNDREFLEKLKGKKFKVVFKSNTDPIYYYIVDVATGKLVMSEVNPLMPFNFIYADLKKEGGNDA